MVFEVPGSVALLTVVGTVVARRGSLSDPSFGVRGVLMSVLCVFLAVVTYADKRAVTWWPSLTGLALVMSGSAVVARAVVEGDDWPEHARPAVGFSGAVGYILGVVLAVSPEVLSG